MKKPDTVRMVDKAGNLANPQKSDQAIWEAAGWVVANHVEGKAIIASQAPVDTDTDH